ncbi:MAG: hypothetical protein U5L10_03090 [Candidatus Moranbacteria bacterium]|nr:hypothetical protein [Candidatus Moranbacteria bacterium]
MSKKQKTISCIEEFVSRYPSILNVKPAESYIENHARCDCLNACFSVPKKEVWSQIKKKSELRQALRKIIIQTIKGIGQEIGRAPTLEEVQDYFIKSGCEVKFKYIIYNLNLKEIHPYSSFKEQAGY